MRIKMKSRSSQSAFNKRTQQSPDLERQAIFLEWLSNERDKTIAKLKAAIQRAESKAG